MYNKDCEVCEGKGSYNVPNYHLEVIERIDCMDCLLEDRFKNDLKDRLTRLLINTSKEKLASIVAEMVVNGVDKNALDDISRIEGIIQTKNHSSALARGLAYSNQ